MLAKSAAECFPWVRASTPCASNSHHIGTLYNVPGYAITFLVLLPPGYFIGRGVPVRSRRWPFIRRCRDGRRIQRYLFAGVRALSVFHAFSIPLFVLKQDNSFTAALMIAAFTRGCFRFSFRGDFSRITFPAPAARNFFARDYRFKAVAPRGAAGCRPRFGDRFLLLFQCYSGMSPLFLAGDRRIVLTRFLRPGRPQQAKNLYTIGGLDKIIRHGDGRRRAFRACFFTVRRHHDRT